MYVWSLTSEIGYADQKEKVSNVSVGFSKDSFTLNQLNQSIYHFTMRDLTDVPPATVLTYAIL